MKEIVEKASYAIDSLKTSIQTTMMMAFNSAKSASLNRAFKIIESKPVQHLLQTNVPPIIEGYLASVLKTESNKEDFMLTLNGRLAGDWISGFPNQEFMVGLNFKVNKFNPNINIEFETNGKQTKNLFLFIAKRVPACSSSVHDFHRHFIDDRFMAVASMTGVGFIYGTRFGMLVKKIGLSVAGKLPI
ncbi:hypothetical protein L195_g005784 [Trifolium pratense]|uniref:Uncharacterized protein n=1 Tax=Trifolium pratense TaxID=57577 RepID=A0A2K3P1R4_TRIPR|nr:hypothetical protein L195_g005784 [Trifolium pratense]